MRPPATIDLDQAKLDPASVFNTPWDVVGAAGLTADDKRSVLIRWEADADALLRATGEGMEPMSDSRSPAELLRTVHEALEQIDAASRHGS
jgi:hypothetical protein